MLQPFPRLQVLGQSGLRRSRSGLVTVFVTHARRQRHQYGFDATAGLQAEERAAVIHEIELDVATATVELKLALALAIGRGGTARHDGRVGVEKAIAHRLQQGKAALESSLIEIIEKQPPDAALLIAVPQSEIVIAPLLVLGIDGFSKRSAKRTCGGVPVNTVLVERIEGRQIEAAAEPPDRFLLRPVSLEIAHIHMRRRHIWIQRMHHQGDAGRYPVAAGQMRTLRRGRGRQRVAHDSREADTRLLEDAPLLQDARAAPSARRTSPDILAELPLAILTLQGFADALLQLAQIR